MEELFFSLQLLEKKQMEWKIVKPRLFLLGWRISQKKGTALNLSAHFALIWLGAFLKISVLSGFSLSVQTYCPNT